MTLAITPSKRAINSFNLVVQEDNIYVRDVPKANFRFLAEVYARFDKDSRVTVRILTHALDAHINHDTRVPTGNLVLLFVNTYVFKNMTKQQRQFVRVDPIARVANAHTKIYVLDGELVTASRFNHELSRQQNETVLKNLLVKFKGQPLSYLFSSYDPETFNSLKTATHALDLTSRSLSQFLSELQPNQRANETMAQLKRMSKQGHADIGCLSKVNEIAQLQREIDQDRVTLRHKQQRLVELLKENAK